jgi:amidase
MNRNKFLKNTLYAGLLISQKDPISNFSKKEGNLKTDIKDNLKIKAFELDETTIPILQNKMEKGEYTSYKITQLYLKRIAEMDKAGPKLNAVIEINPDALEIAKSMDQERKAGKIRGPLHGIPILVKDNISTGDKMMTTAGALAMKGHIAQEDAFIIKQLRKSGAVLLGKTNLSEWANFRSSHSTSAWSSRGKQTKCPYVLDRNPSGSSSGTGSSIAANLSVLGIGTETNGSIVSPSSINGLVGIKPTVGLWSRTGIIPISATQDTAGPMARTVTDAAILLGALTGIDPEDPASPGSQNHFQTDYTPYLKKDGLKGKKIGINKSQLTGNERVVGLFKAAIQDLKNQGAEMVEIDFVKPLQAVFSGETTVLQYEFKDGLNRYLKKYPGKMKDLSDIIQFNKDHADEAMPYFQQETLIASQATGDLTDKTYTDALAKVLSTRDILIQIMKDNSLDALAGITSGPAGCIDLVNGDYGTGFSSSGPAAMAGFPHITLPMGRVIELPVGLSLFSGPYKEGELIGMAYAYEQATLHRAAPKFIEEIGF